ncbi:hypothetical protein DUNSADRAFT_9971 [Dunaliella salina]|uniref:Uncharacterized protein n=1 Tax=Dunaliella salina TaxID=3046 RepID=A0ABQ7GGC0_DUNSA|nr:hypothetical protein DUNSADRAFT_9971 [Dunaliella salina]|eukprot:KAF5833661.1 hypothetical protein DUNSADRAFT_9971 [Dunaliella salina]
MRIKMKFMCFSSIHVLRRARFGVGTLSCFNGLIISPKLKLVCNRSAFLWFLIFFPSRTTNFLIVFLSLWICLWLA